MYRIHELKLKIGEDKGVLVKKIEKLIGIPVKSWKIVRESIDARDKGDIRYVYTVDFEADIPDGKAEVKAEEKVDGKAEVKAEEKADGKAEVKADRKVEGKAEVKIANTGKNRKKIEGLGGRPDSFKIGRYKVELAPDVSYVYPVPGGKFRLDSVAAGGGVRAAKMPLRPVVVGFGPCGMFAALLLAEMGYRPVVLERGKRVEDRVRDVQAFWAGAALNPESNVQFGEGGAGTFSDGKLTTQIKDRRIRKVLEEFSKAGGGEELLYKQKPHIGTDVLRVIVKNIREKIIANGGEIRFESRMSGIRLENSAVSAVEVNGGSGRGGYTLDTCVLITAIGHSARDTFRMLYEKGLPMQQKPFSIGVRIEHPQELINKAQYGRQDIGAADYKLSYHCKNGRGVYTFCMCPGGEVIKAASQEGLTVTNGMSYSARDGRFANSGLLVDVRTSDFASEHPLAGVEFQEKYERLAFENGGGNYELPTTTWGEFRDSYYKRNAADKSVLARGADPADKSAPMNGAAAVEKADLKQTASSNSTVDSGKQLMSEKSVAISQKPLISGKSVVTSQNPVIASLPEFAAESICEAMPHLGRKLKGFDNPDAVMKAVETRSSSPVRILRDRSFEAEIKGIFPGGEGAGYAGGIMSAACDGLRIAEEIIGRYLPYEE